MKTEPDEAVVAWLDRQAAHGVWTTSITVFEIEFGLRRLAEGKRQKRMAKAFQIMIKEVLGGRVLPFDTLAAEASAALSADLHDKGKPVEIRDVQIAGIARARRATVATGNIKQFGRMCETRNPWGDA